MSDDGKLLKRAAGLSLDFLKRLPDRPVGPRVRADDLRAALGGPLPEVGEEPMAVLEHLARGADPGLVAMPGPRYFGFVIGGHLPATLAADWLTSTWDQNATLYATSPANSVAEEVSSGWLLDLLGLPPARASGTSRGARWPTSPAWPRPGTPSSRERAGTWRPTASTARRRSTW